MLGEKGIGHASTLISELLNAHAEGIDAAYAKADHSLTVSMTAKFEPNDKGPGIKVTAGITFVNGKTTEKVSGVFLEGQGDLFIDRTDVD